MITHVQKWGNSLGVRIPKNIAEDIRVEDGATVDLRVEEGYLVIAPVGKPTYTLEELVSKITPENRHESIDFGPPVGKEVW
ncbi:MAG: AbrB/MazE/SpoVT family DNA-binding domain-containing protein [Pirellulales bacterium]|nr:AbrB/MazE/SpoVT family DNA-binding domain-containing protein [Pirellulales bacterium]